MSFLELHDKVSSLTFMLVFFMKDMKGMVVEEVTIEEEEVEKEKEVSKEKEADQEGEKADEKKKEQEKEEEANLDAVDATPIQSIPPIAEATPINTSPGPTKPSKKRKTRSRK